MLVHRSERQGRTMVEKAISERFVISSFSSIARAQIALDVIHSAGFTDENVSFVTRSDSDEVKSIQHLEDKIGILKQVKMAEHTKPSAPIFATTGAAIGGLIATPFALGTMLFPLFIVGPLVGAGAGALLGSLLEPENKEEVRRVTNVRFADTLEQGGAVIIVHADNPVQMQKAWDTLKTCDPVSLSEWESDIEEKVE